MQIVKKGDVELITFDNLTQTGMVKHGFTTRHGGVSTGYYGTMNMGFSRGEDRAPVAENYRILARVLELDENAFVATQQTHTTNVLKVTAKDKGCGVTKDRTYHDIDGLMTNEKGINLVIFGADCVPVFLLDTKNKAIGLAHCGWKGTADRMAEKFVQEMMAAYGTNPKDIVAAIGPSIGKCCFQVDDPVVNLFRKQIALQRTSFLMTPQKKANTKSTCGKPTADCWRKWAWKTLRFPVFAPCVTQNGSTPIGKCGKIAALWLGL